MQGLVDFLHGRVTALTITRVSVANIAALKTYDPPVDSLVGSETPARPARKVFDRFLSTTGRTSPPSREGAAWLRWYDRATSSAPARRRSLYGSRSATTRVRPDRAGTKKSCAFYVAREPADVPGIARLGPDPLDPASTRDTPPGCWRSTHQTKACSATHMVIAGVGNAYSTKSSTPRSISVRPRCEPATETSTPCTPR